MSNDIKRGHIDPNQIDKYDKLKDMSRSLEDLGDWMGAQYMDEANQCYALAGRFRDKAHELRVPLKVEEPEVDYESYLTAEDVVNLLRGDILEVSTPGGRATYIVHFDGWMANTLVFTIRGSGTTLSINPLTSKFGSAMGEYNIKRVKPNVETTPYMTVEDFNHLLIGDVIIYYGFKYGPRRYIYQGWEDGKQMFLGLTDKSDILWDEKQTFRGLHDKSDILWVDTTDFTEADSKNFTKV